jgi:zinc finger BED domain-containing protein 1 (E3 SUMO-protein ligase ZBED1)
MISKLARRFLCIPASSAPSERVFSRAGLTISNLRAGLLPETAGDMVFLNGVLRDVDLNPLIFG